MCSGIVETAEIAGCGRGTPDWIAVTEANVSYDHPFHASYEHALNIDFVNAADGPGARIAVELSPAAAQRLADTILAALARGREYESAPA